MSSFSSKACSFLGLLLATHWLCNVSNLGIRDRPLLHCFHFHTLENAASGCGWLFHRGGSCNQLPCLISWLVTLCFPSHTIVFFCVHLSLGLCAKRMLQSKSPLLLITLSPHTLSIIEVVVQMKKASVTLIFLSYKRDSMVESLSQHHLVHSTSHPAQWRFCCWGIELIRLIATVAS